MQHTVYRFHHVIFAACIAVKTTHIPVAKHTVCLRIRNRNDHGADVGVPMAEIPASKLVALHRGGGLQLAVDLPAVLRWNPVVNIWKICAKGAPLFCAVIPKHPLGIILPSCLQGIADPHIKAGIPSLLAAQQEGNLTDIGPDGPMAMIGRKDRRLHRVANTFQLFIFKGGADIQRMIPAGPQVRLHLVLQQVSRRAGGQRHSHKPVGFYIDCAEGAVKGNYALLRGVLHDLISVRLIFIPYIVRILV